MTGPDSLHPRVNNNAFTNALASLAIHWGRYFACLCNREERTEVPDEWIQKALYLELPFDNVKRLHYEFEGYRTGMLNISIICNLSYRYYYPHKKKLCLQATKK